MNDDRREIDRLVVRMARILNGRKVNIGLAALGITLARVLADAPPEIADTWLATFLSAMAEIRHNHQEPMH